MSAASEARDRAGLTIEQAARKLRIAPSTLKRYERCGCGETRAREIAGLYRCSMDLFLYGSASGLARVPTQLS